MCSFITSNQNSVWHTADAQSLRNEQLPKVSLYLIPSQPSSDSGQSMAVLPMETTKYAALTPSFLPGLMTRSVCQFPCQLDTEDGGSREVASQVAQSIPNVHQWSPVKWKQKAALNSYCKWKQAKCFKSSRQRLVSSYTQLPSSHSQCSLSAQLFSIPGSTPKLLPHQVPVD